MSADEWTEECATVTVQLPRGEVTLPPAQARALQREGALRCGPYELVREVGRGGCGTVFVGRREDTAEEHAVSVRAWPATGRLETRWREALRRVDDAALDHPYLARLHGGGLEGGLPWYAQDLAQGFDLEQLLRERSLSREDGLEVLAMTARAVGHAHARGLANLDELEPSQVFVPAGHPPRVVQFGLALRRLHEPSSCTGGVIIGGPWSLPPEVLRTADPAFGAATDVYALGVMLFRLLTGRRPFDGGNVVAIFREILERPAPIPSTLDPTVPRALDEVCLRALEKRPEDRPPHADAFADALVAAMLGDAPPRRLPRPAARAETPGVVRRLVSWVTGA